jgi:ribonuclease HI
LKVWTDGSSRGNGKKNAEAGVGVYFGYDDERYVSTLPFRNHCIWSCILIFRTRNLAERLAGDPQTNQRAELTGILRALELVPPTQNLEIITDSNYGINCISVWYENWTKRGWVTSTGGPVVNRDLVEKIREKIDERDGKGTKTLFTWVKGHSEDEGNIGADLLAVQGSRLPEVIQ